jgi:membrane-associated phospholipid phosphatase
MARRSPLPSDLSADLRPASLWAYASFARGFGWIWATPVALGLLAALALRGLDGGQGDEALFRAVNAWGAAAPTTWAMASVAGLGLSVFLMLGSAYAVACARGQSVRAAADALGALLICFPIGGAVTHGLKALFDTPRPPAVLADIFIIGQPLMHHSMPSGHSITAGAFAGLVLASYRLGGRGAAVVLALAAAVVVSRMTTAAHWPSDVGAGAALGWAIAPLAVTLLRRCALSDWLLGRTGQTLMALGLITASVSMTQQVTGYPMALPLQWALAAVTTGAALYQLMALWRPTARPDAAHG